MYSLKQGEEVGPFIYVYENVIDNSEEIISLAKLSGGPSSAEVFDESGSLVVDKNIRDTNMQYFPPVFSNDIRWFALAQSIWRYANQYAIDHDIVFSNMEYLQFLNYKPNSGFYRPHVDSGPASPRIISAVLYLNDVEEGGETHFTKFDVQVSPKAGRLLLFPSNFAYKHQAKTPISNEKNVMITFFNI